MNSPGLEEYSPAASMPIAPIILPARSEALGRCLLRHAFGARQGRLERDRFLLRILVTAAADSLCGLSADRKRAVETVPAAT